MAYAGHGSEFSPALGLCSFSARAVSHQLLQYNMSQVGCM